MDNLVLYIVLIVLFILFLFDEQAHIPIINIKHKNKFNIFFIFSLHI